MLATLPGVCVCVPVTICFYFIRVRSAFIRRNVPASPSRLTSHQNYHHHRHNRVAPDVAGPPTWPPELKQQVYSQLKWVWNDAAPSVAHAVNSVPISADSEEEPHEPHRRAPPDLLTVYRSSLAPGFRGFFTDEGEPDQTNRVCLLAGPMPKV